MAALLALLTLPITHIIATEPNPPTWPSSVYVFNEGNDQTVQATVDKIFAQNGGTNPPNNGQWSEARFALLFTPGTYHVNVNLGYYTSLSGLGKSPSDVKIDNVIVQNGATDYTIGALNNFWRSAENFATTPTMASNNQPATMGWAVSQGISLRRVIINGSLDLWQGQGYSSGGYMCDVQVTGTVRSGSQQQWFSRNIAMGQWVGGVWNMMYMGVANPPNEQCANKTVLSTTIPSTPIIAEKPFISYNNSKYYLNVPGVEYKKIGPTNFDSAIIEQIDFSNVYVTNNATDTAATINAKLAAGLHVVLTGGTYNLDAAIQVTLPNTVILGIGYPTLMSTNGNSVIEVADNMSGVRISGLLLQAGPKNTSSLFKFGTTKGQGTGVNFLYDIWARIGGLNDPSQVQWTADVAVQLNSNNIVLDNAWLWRADHGVSGVVKNAMNPCNVGLQVNGDNVITYSLKVEHTLQNLVEWVGNNGTAYFYQCEFPYDVTQAQYGDAGYNAWRVDNAVTTFNGYGLGIYSYFRDFPVTVKNAIQAPNVAGVNVKNVGTVWLNGLEIMEQHISINVNFLMM
eukprot:739858_1